MAHTTSRRVFVQAVSLTGLAVMSGCRIGGPNGLATPTPVKVPRIGWLSGGAFSSTDPARVAFEQGLREHGYLDGQTITIERRYAEGYDERLGDLAHELVRLPVDLLLASGTSASAAAKQATTTLPIVSVSGDPVTSGLIASLARPGGNLTGFTLAAPGISGKQLEVLKTAFPAIRRLASITNAASPAAIGYQREVQAAAQVLGIPLQRLEIRGPDDFDTAFLTAVQGHVDALMALDDPVAFASRSQILGFAAQQRLPAIYDRREWVEAGGLMAYGTNFPAIFRRAASLVYKLLHGVRPDELPVEQPTTFDFVINLKTAQSLGLTIPRSVLDQATEVIQ